MSKKTEWITPREASKRITARVGYVVTPDDLKQLRRNWKIKNINQLSERIDLYDANEIATIAAPNKRKRVPADQWERVMRELNEKRKNRSQTA